MELKSGHSSGFLVKIGRSVGTVCLALICCGNKFPLKLLQGACRKDGAVTCCACGKEALALTNAALVLMCERLIVLLRSVYAVEIGGFCGSAVCNCVLLAVVNEGLFIAEAAV